MRTVQYRRTQEVSDIESLNEVLARRDDCGGALIWLSAGDTPYPMMGIRISGDIADVHYFPQDNHPGFRCLGGVGLPAGGFTTLVYMGADPADGELTPNEFVVSFNLAQDIAREFFRTKQMSNVAAWFEL